MIDLEEKYLSEIKRILKENIPNIEVRVFGSRIKHCAEKYSDIDLALVGPDSLNINIIEDLKEKFSASNLPIIVDIIDWNQISDSFKKIIEENFVIINNNLKT